MHRMNEIVPFSFDDLLYGIPFLAALAMLPHALLVCLIEEDFLSLPILSTLLALHCEFHLIPVSPEQLCFFLDLDNLFLLLSVLFVLAFSDECVPLLLLMSDACRSARQSLKENMRITEGLEYPTCSVMEQHILVVYQFVQIGLVSMIHRLSIEMGMMLFTSQYDSVQRSKPSIQPIF